MNFKTRPLSWSSISQFQYDKEKWYEKYVLGARTPENAAMSFGKIVGERLAKEQDYLPLVPRGKIYEYELRACIDDDIDMIGFIDSYDPENKQLYEYKTGKLWDKEKADNHGQLKMYALMLFLKEQIKPEDLNIYLVSMETEARGDFTMTFVKGMKPVIFEVKLTTKDVLMFATQIINTVKEMKEYIASKA